MSFYLDLDAILSSKPPAADAAEDEFVGEEKRRGVPEGAVGVTAATGAAAGAGGDGEEDGLFARRPVFRSLAVAPAMHPGAASAVRLPADHAPASEAEFVPSSVSSVAAPAAARSGASLPPCLPICGLQRTHVALLAGVSPLSVMSHVTAALQKAPYSVDGQLDGFKVSAERVCRVGEKGSSGTSLRVRVSRPLHSRLGWQCMHWVCIYVLYALGGAMRRFARCHDVHRPVFRPAAPPQPLLSHILTPCPCFPSPIFTFVLCCFFFPDSRV